MGKALLTDCLSKRIHIHRKQEWYYGYGWRGWENILHLFDFHFLIVNSTCSVMEAWIASLSLPSFLPQLT
jgi:hypothetical protein